MTLNDSPSLNDLSSTLPEHEPQQGKRRSWVVIAVLFMVVAILGVVNFMQSDAATVLRGAGTISGQVVDANGVALYEAEVFLVNGGKSAWTDVNGYFELGDVPAGDHTLVAGYKGYGVELSVVVTAGVELQVGTIVIDVLDSPWIE